MPIPLDVGSSPTILMKDAIFGAGCFWGVEKNFRGLLGVIHTRVGYCGGRLTNPTYEEVCQGDTGHAEVVKITFDPDIIQFSTLLNHFWKIHYPTTRNRQGPDIGSQYRSVIFFQDADQHTVAVQSRLDENRSKRYSLPIVTEITSKQPFYEAEEYHQQYLEKLNKFFCHI